MFLEAPFDQEFFGTLGAAEDSSFAVDGFHVGFQAAFGLKLLPTQVANELAMLIAVDSRHVLPELELGGEDLFADETLSVDSSLV